MTSALFHGIICTRWNILVVITIKERKNTTNKLFIFAGMTDDEINDITSDIAFTVQAYARTETIFSPESYRKEMGFIISGECEVRQTTHEDGKIILNTLRPGDSFGILTIFGDGDPFPTQVYARKNTEILFIEKETMLRLIEKSPMVARNVIEFLAKRVAFLNKRIGTVSKSTVDSKLASYLISECKRLGSVELNVNLKRCSEIIGAGRTSVYRSLENLKNNGYIKAENKIITILNLENLEEFSK